MSRIVTDSNNFQKSTKLKFIDQFRPDDVFYMPGPIDTDLLLGDLDKYGRPAYIVGDQAGNIVLDGVNIYTVPFRGLDMEMEKFKHLQLQDQINTAYCFNFFINNKQINRHLLVKLVEHFELDSFDYVLGNDQPNFDMQHTIGELASITDVNLDADFKTKILSPIKLPPKHDGNNIGEWTSRVSQMFDQTAVSLVSEINGHQLASVFSDKTLYAIMGLTFPIYIGGYGHADYLKQIGFDTFDDIIDHSYQFKTTLIERCYYAFKNNLRLLSDTDYAVAVRQQHLPRLLANRDLLYSGVLTKHTEKVLDSWPDPLSSVIRPYWQYIRNTPIGKVFRSYAYFD
jgi:hypothetical protein